jgi:hypothetical protein
LFEFRFGSIKELKKPDICGALEHTRVYESSETRLKQVAVDAALLLRQRKNTLAELLSPKIQDQIATQIHARMAEELDVRKRQLEEEIAMQKEEERRKEEEVQRVMEERQRKIHEELDAEKRALSPALLAPLGQFVQRSTFESRLQRKHMFSPLKQNTLWGHSASPHPSPMETRSPSQMVALSARRPSLLPDSHPILIPESSQPYSKSVDSSPVIQPQLGPNPAEFTLPDAQNTVIMPQ